MSIAAQPGKAILAGGLLLLGLILSACGSDSPAPTATSIPEEPTATSAPPAPTEAEPVATPTEAETYPEPVEIAITDAAIETGVLRDEVTIVSIEEREWPSTALGCPQPGFSYPQVVTPGYFIRIEAGGSTLEYHTNLRTSIVLCTRSP